MKHNIYQLLIPVLVLLACCPLRTLADNPFLSMVGQTYGEYHDRFYNETGKLFYGDSLDRQKLMAYFNEAARLDPTEEWKLNARLLAADIHFYESRRGGMTVSADSAEAFISEVSAIARAAKRYGLPAIRLRAQHKRADTYRIFLQDYDRAFHCYLQLADELRTVSTRDFPRRPLIYRDIAELYTRFHDYDKAIVYWQLIIDDPDAAGDIYGSHAAACFSLGVCYRDGYHDFVRSDLYLRRTLEEKSVLHVWKGIVSGELGLNRLMQKDYTAALPLLLSSIEQITRVNDFQYVSDRAVNIAEIYLQQNHPATAKTYLDKASDCLRQAGIAERNDNYYAALCHYYSLTRNQQLAIAYFDSTLLAAKHENEAFSGLVLRRVEQQLHRTEMERRAAETRFIKALLGVIFAALAVSLLFLLFYRRLYRKKSAAYAELARKAEQWAAGEFVERPRHKTPRAVSREDRELVAQIHRLMHDDRLFADSKLSLHTLADRLGIGSHVLSNAINEVSGKNFNAFVNDYRIKESIRILSASRHSTVYIDELYEQVGFAGRSTFYAAFKKTTGLSPTEYRTAVVKKH